MESRVLKIRDFLIQKCFGCVVAVVVDVFLWWLGVFRYY